MKRTRFQVLCADNVWRYVFCRSMNGGSPLTRSEIIPTETRQKAYVGTEKDLAYFQEHSNHAPIRAEQPIP
jgi:hypothetical protein